jgi:hypothetical protein
MIFFSFILASIFYLSISMHLLLTSLHTFLLWKRRYNNESYRLYGDQDLVSHIKVGRIQWAGHVARLEDPAKQVLESQLYGTRNASRPKLRWGDGVAQDVKRFGINS